MGTQIYAIGGTLPKMVSVEICTSDTAWMAYHMAGWWVDKENDMGEIGYDLWQPDTVNAEGVKKANELLPETLAEYRVWAQSYPNPSGQGCAFEGENEGRTEENYRRARDFIREAASYGCFLYISY